MYYLGRSTLDKNIVDRTKRVRNPLVSRAIKETRHKLSENHKSDFTEELLKKNAQSFTTFVVYVPLMLLIVSFIAWLNDFGVQIFAWLLISLLSYAYLFVIARRIISENIRALRVSRLPVFMNVGYFVCGLTWVWFTALQCDSCGFLQSHVIKTLTLLAVMACSIFLSTTLASLMIMFLPALTVMGILTVYYEGAVLELTMLALLYGFILFFTFLQKYIHKTHLLEMIYHCEKNELVTQLETAKSTSDEARVRAEEANLAKSRFLASMSHELRTPLNAILGFSEVMTHEVLGPMGNQTYKEYASDIHTSGQHLLGLINEILDLSRIEAGRQTLNEECVKLTDIVEDAVHLITLKARAKNIKITSHFENSMPFIWVDERCVRQITLNLLSNAVKFTPLNGEISVKVGWTNGGGQYISIKDNGPGIAENEIPIVLSAFGQGSIAIKNADQGTGLGLPIVQAMMNMHGGKFDLRSKLREGTEVFAIFPRSRVAIALKKMADTQRTAQAS